MENKIMDVRKVISFIIDINERSKSKIKSQAQDILFASHIIAQNKGKLQATICMKLARELYYDRIDRGLTDVVATSFYQDIEFIGDVAEAMTIFHAFKASGQIELDSNGKLLPVNLNNELIDVPAIRPHNEKQIAIEIRRGIEDQKLPKAVEALSNVKYSIDEQIREVAEADELQDYANNRILATSYEQEDTFNVHYFADSRIRIYPDHTTGYSPQGSDLGKAIIKNESKEATHDLTPEFIRMAKDFMDGKEPFEIEPHNILLLNWRDAEYPYRMKQLQNDYKEYIWTGFTSANSDLDARCSGSQILSGLGRYDDITAHIGMEVEEADLDLYEKHAAVFTLLVAEIAPEIIERNKHLIDEVVDKKIKEKVMKVFKRKVAKRPTMTFVYNATLTSIIEEFRSKEIKFMDEDVVEAAKIMQKALHKAAGGTALLMDWMKQSAKIISNSGAKTIQWTRPDGLIASQTYIKKRELRIEKKIQMTKSEIKHAMLQGRKKPKSGWRHSIKCQLRVPHLDLNGQEVSNPSRHVNGISANIVHSLDSCVAFKIIEILSAKGIEVTRFVHDSLSVHMNHKQDLYDAVIEAHLWLFNSDFFENLKQEWEMLYGVTLPDLPEKGNWNPETLRDCKKFWN